jgi:hypothetical protein
MAKPPLHRTDRFEVVLRCTRSPKKPTEYRGQWPRRHHSYFTTVYTPPGSEEARVFVHGLLANAPHDSFPMWGWEWIATLWLN